MKRRRNNICVSDDNRNLVLIDLQELYVRQRQLRNKPELDVGNLQEYGKTPE